MIRFYKQGTCDWCKRHGLRVFITTFESETTKYMCDRCKEFLEHKYNIMNNIPNCVDFWDETAPNYPTKVPKQPERIDFYHRPKKFAIKQSLDKKVTLWGFKGEDKFVVEYENIRSLSSEKVRYWEYKNLAPASRRYSLCLEAKGDGGL